MEGQRNTSDAASSRFTWRIQNFSKLTVKKLYSDTFIAGGCKWRLVIFPKGNNVDYLSIYLDVADSTSLPNGWSRNAKFSLALVNQFSNRATIKKDTQTVFNAKQNDWGFTSFFPLSNIKNRAERYLVNDTLTVEAEVLVLSAVHYSKIESEKEVTNKATNETPLSKKAVVDTEAKVVPPTVTDQEVNSQPPTPLPPPRPLTEDTKIIAKDPPSEPIQSPENLQTVSRGLLKELSSRNRTQKSPCNEKSVSSQESSPEILQQQKEALKGFFNMSLEAIKQANAFSNIEGIIHTLLQHTSNLHEKTILEDLVSHLQEFKESIPNATTAAETAQACRTSLTGKTTDLDSKLEQRQKELCSLESEFSRLSEEEAKLQAELQRLITQKNSVALELQKVNEETSKDLQEWRNLEGEIKQANAEWLGAKEKLALSNVRWKLFKEDLGLGKLNIS